MDRVTTKGTGPVITYEKEVVVQMVDIYCSKKHGTRHGEICSDCTNLLTYAHDRLDKCRYGENKPTCRKCPTHCYRQPMRNQMREVMRTAGPRMFFRAPLKWIHHEIRDRKRRRVAREKIKKREGR